jgi:uncharacterized RDD family membrane protein YckC
VEPTTIQMVDNLPAGTKYAGFWWRFLAAFLDGIILQIVSIMSGLVIGLALGLTLGTLGLDRQIVQALCGLAGGAMGIVVAWLYHALLESSEKQATLGKMICKIRVIDLEGQRISFMRATGRYFSKFISAVILLIGYIMAGFTEKKQALHDLIAGTLVIRTE